MLNKKKSGCLMKSKIKLFIVSSFIIAFSSLFILLSPGCDESYSSQVKGTEKAKLTTAPYVPQPITRNHPTKVVVDLETTEIVKRLADGVEYVFWTFGGEVPGKFIRIKEGDEVEFNLHNSPNSKMPHNIDLHAVTGPGGGAEASFTAPGHTSTFSFKALNPGLYVYHCATAPVGLHIANGMYGLILVEPEEGLSPVDREYYVMQSEFYTEGSFGETGLQNFNQENAIDERPAYVVFNGSVGAITGDKSLTAKAGEKIRLFIGNGGPNLVSSFHVIGEIFDKVYGEGGTVVSQKNVQTTLIPAGGSAIVEFTVDVPGTYILVDHSIFRAFNKGAIGMMKVTGEKDLVIYSGKQKEDVYLGSNDEPNQDMFSGPINIKQTSEISQASPNEEKETDMSSFGKRVFQTTCAPCHQQNGEGLPNVFPPLAKSDYLNKNKEAAIDAVLNGLSGEITVNRKKYNGIMPQQNLNNKQIAAVLTYVYKQWDNSGKTVTEDEVAKIRSKKILSAK